MRSTCDWWILIDGSTTVISDVPVWPLNRHSTKSAFEFEIFNFLHFLNRFRWERVPNGNSIIFPQNGFTHRRAFLEFEKPKSGCAFIIIIYNQWITCRVCAPWTHSIENIFNDFICKCSPDWCQLTSPIGNNHSHFFPWRILICSLVTGFAFHTHTHKHFLRAFFFPPLTPHSFIHFRC